MGRISLPCSVSRKKCPQTRQAGSCGSFIFGKAAGAGRYESIQPSGPTEYPCYIKEDNRPYATAGADVPSQGKAFVRRTTPHYGGTSRGTSYSVRRYSTPKPVICKSPIQVFLPRARKISPGYNRGEPGMIRTDRPVFPGAVSDPDDPGPDNPHDRPGMPGGILRFPHFLRVVGPGIWPGG